MSNETDSDSASQKKSTTTDELLSAKETKKSGKASKSAKSAADASPHVTGRVMHVEIDSADAAFSVKPKKGKIETFRLNEAGFLASAATLLVAAIGSKAKVRVEYSEVSDGKRSVTKLRMQA